VRYRFSPGGEGIDPAVRTVYIEPFANRTSEANLETMFRSAFTDWFAKGAVSSSSIRHQADALWRGGAQTLTTTTLSYRASNIAAEERMVVVLDLQFIHRESGRVIWSDRAFSGTQDYAIPEGTNTESARKNALAKLAMDTAERAYRMMMSGF
jgi:hypothetical protein